MGAIPHPLLITESMQGAGEQGLTEALDFSSDFRGISARKAEQKGGKKVVGVQGFEPQ
jgi:hypothetical protein